MLLETFVVFVEFVPVPVTVFVCVVTVSIALRCIALMASAMAVAAALSRAVAIYIMTAAGLLTAVGAAFSLKAGSGLGGALPAWILDWSQYVPNAAQTSKALFGIEVGFIWLPAVFYAIAVIPVFFYHHYERLEPKIREDLELRRSAASAMDAAV